MSVAVPQVRVGEPLRHQSLSVFPLFDGRQTPVEYLLADEGIGSGSVTVEEVSEGGSVPDLLVENKGDVRVLFLEGEELVGAKQNRVLNTSVLIAAKSKVKIPVSCVEQGRWRYRSKQFGSSGSHSPSKLRYFLKSSVSHALKENLGHRSDQGKVWAEVARQQRSLGAASDTRAMSDTFDTYKEQVDQFREKLRVRGGRQRHGRGDRQEDRRRGPLRQAFHLRQGLGPADVGLRARCPGAAGRGRPGRNGRRGALLGAANGLPWEKAVPVGEGEEYRRSRAKRSTPRPWRCTMRRST